MTAPLSPDSEAVIAAQLRSGRFASREQVLDAGIRLLAEQGDLASRREVLRALVQRGIDDADAGRLANITLTELLSEARNQRR